MKSRVALFIAATALLAAPAVAQEKIGPGTIEFTLIPAGGLFFVSSDTESPFTSYEIGGALAIDLNRYVGFEGEVGMALGVWHQSLSVSGVQMDEAPPNILDYSVNMTFAPLGGTRRATPYAAGGVGSMLMYEHDDLGVATSKAFLTGNIGGGLKWYTRGRWGLRADYRFVMLQSSGKAPAFFGREGRFAHRVYGAVVLNLSD